MGRDIKLAEERISGYQNFVNKLWNAARFVQMNPAAADRSDGDGVLQGATFDFAETWIRSRLARTISEARDAIDAYRFNDYANALYQFTWHEFCDWYIEMSKLSLNSGDAVEANRSRRVLQEILEQILLLLHPIMPFVTEEIWQVLSEERHSIMVQRYPLAQPDWIDEETEAGMAFLTSVIRAIRNLRTELNCPPSREVRVIFRGAQKDLDLLRERQTYVRTLARVSAAEYRSAEDPPKGAATAVVGTTEIYLPLDDLINLDEERARLSKEVGKMEDELARVQKKLDNADFLAKAKSEVIHKEREKASQFEDKLRALRSSLEKLQEIQAGRS